MEKNEQVMVEVDRWFGFLDENGGRSLSGGRE